MRLEGKCAIITGAASGLGRATVREFHAAGANVLLLDRDEEKVQRAAAELGTRARWAVADVRKPEEIEKALNLAAEAFGELHISVSCAGIPSSAKIISRGEAHDAELWSRVVDINLTGTFHVMRLAAARMVSNMPDAECGERGVIINTASVAAFDGQKGQVAYAATKAGVVGMTLPAARDLAGHAIRCVAIAPGLFETELFDAIPPKGVEALKQGLLYPSRMGVPTEFSAFARHIVENSYLNGSCLRLDGGARLP